MHIFQGYQCRSAWVRAQHFLQFTYDAAWKNDFGSIRVSERMRHAATELHINPDILAIEITSQTFAFIYMLPLLLVLLNKADSTRKEFFCFPPSVRTVSLECCTSQTIKYASEQMRAIQRKGSHSLLDCVCHPQPSIKHNSSVNSG